MCRYRPGALTVALVVQCQEGLTARRIPLDAVAAVAAVDTMPSLGLGMREQLAVPTVARLLDGVRPARRIEVTFLLVRVAGCLYRRVIAVWAPVAVWSCAVTTLGLHTHALQTRTPQTAPASVH